MNLAKLHEQAINKYKNVRGKLDAHKEVIGETVNRGLAAVESALGGGAAAAIDFYMGTKTDAIPEAMIGPVPVVMASAFGLTVISIVMQKEEWSRHLAGFANGLGAASTYAEGLRFLKAHETATTTTAAST